MRFDAMSPEIAAAVSNDHLHLIVNPTERCNLRCAYCYETFALGKMPRAVVSGIVNLVKRRVEKGLKTFQLEFFGGEPLVAWDVVESLALDLSEICRAGGATMLGAMTTNGVLLTRARLDRLAACEVRSFQVTLDGPQTVHDRRRVTRQGAGSFAAVWKALQTLKAAPHPVEVLIRMHFDPTTLEHLLGGGFVQRAAESLVKGDERFRMHFHAVGRWGGPKDQETPVFASASAENAAIKRLIDEALAAGCAPTQFIQYRRDAALGESGHAICYAARANAFVIRSDGRVAKCTVAFEDDRNTVGRLSENGDLVIDHARHLPWLQGLVSGDSRGSELPGGGISLGRGRSLGRSARAGRGRRRDRRRLTSPSAGIASLSLAVTPKERSMASKRILIAGAALAASSLQAFASLPQTTSPADAPVLPAVAGPTGLTAVDLIVGRDGTVAVDVHARALRLACNSGSCARDSC